SFERAEIDMGRQVLVPNRAERVFMDSVLVIGFQRALGALRTIEFPGGVAVVDNQNTATQQLLRGLGKPVRSRQVDLGLLPLGQLDPRRFQIAGDLRCRWRSELLGEPTVVPDYVAL